MEKEVVMVFVVSGVLLKKDGKYLLVQEKQARAYKLWNLPAGRVDVGESLEESAVREAKEECGYDVEIKRKVGVFQNTATESPKHVFVGKIIGGELKFPDDEILDARWFTLEEIQQMKSELRGEWILQAIELFENT